MGHAHGVTPTTPVSADDARNVARVMGALSTPSRVRILAHLREGPSSVGDLAAAVEMEQPAVSHQLRILRDLGLVVGSRSGRHVIYGLYDPHVATLLDEALRHFEHIRTGAPDPPRAPVETTATSKGAA
jgi:DNA-binding transcriptional ArsR family regulator